MVPMQPHTYTLNINKQLKTIELKKKRVLGTVQHARDSSFLKAGRQRSQEETPAGLAQQISDLCKVGGNIQLCYSGNDYVCLQYIDHIHMNTHMNEGNKGRPKTLY